MVEEALGPVDILVNNAGIPGGGEFADLETTRSAAIVEVNLLGVMYGTRAFLPSMLARGHGHIVNVASLAGRFAPLDARCTRRPSTRSSPSASP